MKTVNCYNADFYTKWLHGSLRRDGVVSLYTAPCHRSSCRVWHSSEHALVGAESTDVDVQGRRAPRQDDQVLLIEHGVVDGLRRVSRHFELHHHHHRLQDEKTAR